MLDVLPGEVLKGRVRSIGGGVGTEPGQPGTLPQVDNNRDWLRQAQRFPVAVEFDRRCGRARTCASAARRTCWSTPATTADERAGRAGYG